MFQLFRIQKPNEALLSLIKMLDKELAVTDGEDHDFYHQYNGLDDIKHFVLSTQNNIPIACGAFKKFDTISVEIKRMYVRTDQRGKGFAVSVLKELELWAKEVGYQYTVLETGKRQLAAIHLYEKCGYSLIPNYGQYADMENSLCFIKKL